MRSRCHCKGLGRSAALQPLPLPHAASELCSPCGTAQQAGLLSEENPQLKLSSTAPHYEYLPWRHTHVPGTLCIHTRVCVFPTGTGRHVREEWADLSLAPAPLLCPLRVLPGSHAVAQGFLPAP